MSQPLKLHLVKLNGILTRHDWVGRGGVLAGMHQQHRTLHLAVEAWSLMIKPWVLSNFLATFPAGWSPFEWWRTVRETHPQNGRNIQGGWQEDRRVVGLSLG